MIMEYARELKGEYTETGLYNDSNRPINLKIPVAFISLITFFK